MNLQNNVQFKVLESGLATITLSAHKKLNALDTDMLFQIRSHLMDWDKDPKVKVILFTSSLDKAFCAGGDVKSLALNIQSRGMDAAKDFFTTEYSADYLVYQINKPVVAMVRGICMGGGLGLIQGCSHRVFHIDSMIAMPEISIGLFPDVGASYFLSKTPLGKILGITAYRLNTHEAFSLDLCDYVTKEDQQAEIIEKLQIQDWSYDNEENHEICSRMVEKVRFNAEELADKEFLSLDPSDINKYESNSERVKFAQKSYQEGSPLSQKLIQRQFEFAKDKSLKDCFLMEWQLALNCCEYGDFCEGVQAKLIEKTNQPQWQTDYKLSIDDFFIRSEPNLLKNFLDQLT